MSDSDLRPWVPPGARPFVVGDRVKVRLSGECRHRNDRGHEVSGGEIGVIRNIVDPDLIAQVNANDPDPLMEPSHNITVTLDAFREWFGKGGPYYAYFYFAPSELELLEAAR